MEKENVIKAFKAFDKDFKCRDFQYEVGKEYEESDIKVCSKGFHACENPFDVLDNYPLIDNDGNVSRFAEVEQSGDIERDSNKVCSSRIKVKAELSLGQFVKACVEWIKEATSHAKCEAIDKSYYAKIGSSGYYAKIGSSGDSAQIGRSGDYAKIGSSGDYAKINSEGRHSVVCCAGHGSKAKAKVGSWITLSEWEYLDSEGCYLPICVKTERVDGERIKADTWYMLMNGEFVEV